MAINIKNNYGPNIEVKDGGTLNLYQGRDGMWRRADADDAEQVEVLEVTAVPAQLCFFDMVEFGAEDVQPQLAKMLREMALQFDTTSGRGWFGIYAGYRYYKKQTAVMGCYTDFFADIEALVPDLLQGIDTTKQGEARYHKYTTLLGREAAAWYMNGQALPPLNELSVWKNRFTGDKNRYEQSTLIIKEVYKRLNML